ncbi:hypothetical protein GGTG_04304 [Gaeumannomyces tritici R3-111a-1]|uniref:Chromo domain-containing protein n=1 Tax=Gaeumannomyces tritici (strain R3-111a-1) TaxID=644352 RepID=J3NSQ5_GAET3|nr:hypothetical protein GGTG_04304 [Gaeumannomyces tritici R3-111a-1]EJT79218.1 hypothetical protein GGTG_04304 [Gaeumannomyces tritici R3-111a-1]
MSARQGSLPLVRASAPDEARPAAPEAPSGQYQPAALPVNAASADQAVGAAEDKHHDDHVSIASSEDPDLGPDHMYEVEALHAEKILRDGSKKYLIEWTNYAFKDWSWEPAEAINDVLRDEWERTKHEIAAGLKPPQHEVIAKWRQAKASEIERRERKNAERVRLNLEPIYYPDFPTSDSEMSDESEAGASVEALTETPTEAAEPPRSSVSGSGGGANAQTIDKPKDSLPHQAKPPATPRGKQRIFTGLPAAAPAAAKATVPKSTVSSSSVDSAARGKVAVEAGVRSATGYQGTARPLGSKTDALSKSLASQRPAAAAKTAASRTARKSAPPIRNVFIDGKKRKPRRKSSTEIPANPALETSPTSTSGAKFWNLSTKRKIQLRGRDLENADPGLSLQNVVFASHVDPAVLRASALAEATTPGNIRPAQEGHAGEPNASEGATAGNSPSVVAAKRQADPAAAGNSVSAPTEKRQAESAAAPDAPRAKKRKSVHFADTQSPKAVSTAVMDIDDPVAPNVDDNNDNNSVDDGIPMVLDSPVIAESPSEQHTVRKWTLSEYQAARVSTRDVMKKAVFGAGSSTSLEVCFKGIPNERPWLPDFLAEESVHFSHTCLADTFLARQTMRSPLEPHWHGNLTSPVEQGEEALSNVAERLKATGSGIIFARPCYNILAYPSKLDDWAFPELQGAASSTLSEENSALRYHIFIPHVEIPAFLNWKLQPQPIGGSDRHQAMDTVFGMNQSLYNSLVAPKPEGAATHKHLFYMLFPPSKVPYFLQLMLWIRDCNPDAQVFVPMKDGSWRAFLQLASRNQDSAVLIVHESSMSMLRQVPSLASFLGNGRDHLVWFWPDKGSASPALIPSVPELPGEASKGRFDIQPVRLFPHNHVFLLTPSFYIAEPDHALDLVLALPLSNNSRHGARKLLMVPKDIVPFLDHVSAHHVKDDKTTVRHELALAMLDMIGPRLTVIPDQSYATPVLFVDEEIDARDEQSLVNWFGAWSIAHSDQYRRFHVAGTTSKSPAECPMWMPRYEPGTTNDPDALRRVQQEETQRAKQAVSQQLPQPAPVVHMAPPAARAPIRPGRFQSRILKFDDFDSLHNHLFSLHRPVHRNPGFWRLYGYPVMYTEGDVYKPGHVLNHGTFEAWWNYTWPFSKKYHLYASFFYTEDDAWDPDAESSGLYAPRQPWLVFLRSKCREQTELLIVDPAAHHRLSGVARPLLTDLTTAQQKLVKLVVETSKRKFCKDYNAPQTLQQVWLGDIPNDTGSDFDACLNFVEFVIDNWDTALPAGDEMLDHGFKPVNVPELEPLPDLVPPDSGPKDGGKYSVVFHPPAAHKPPLGASLCKNHMVEVAQREEMHGRSAAWVKYKYRPTTAWYADQRAEGRDFTHINVAGWDTISKMSLPTRKPTGCQQDESSRPSTRE